MKDGPIILQEMHQYMIQTIFMLFALSEVIVLLQKVLIMSQSVSYQMIVMMMFRYAFHALSVRVPPNGK